MIVDRLRVRGDVRERIAQSLETALERGGGRAVVFDLDGEGETAPFGKDDFHQKCLSALRFRGWRIGAGRLFPVQSAAGLARIAAVQD
mgnify:CR=1 FL=1